MIVIGASFVTEQTASKLGARHAVPDIVVGGLVLAAVTGLPNAVAAVYLALHRRGPATLSTAMNSNALNVTLGLLLPSTILGLRAASRHGTLVAGWYLGLTVFALGIAYGSRGLRRAHGVLIVLTYLAFAGLVVTSSYRSQIGVLFSIALPTLVGLALATSPLRRPQRPRSGPLGADRNGADPRTTESIARTSEDNIDESSQASPGAETRPPRSSPE